MTHFIGAVLVPASVDGELNVMPTKYTTLYGSDGKDVEAQAALQEYLNESLEKFSENNDVPRYVSLTKEQAIAKSKADVEDYRTGMYAKYLKDPQAYRAQYNYNHDHIKYIEQEFPLKLEWTDEQHYQDVAKWEEPEDLDEAGNIYSTYNPYSRWDWWTIGGRWEQTYRDRQGETVEGMIEKVTQYIKDAENPVEIAKMQRVEEEIARVRDRMSEKLATYQDYETARAQLLECAAYAPWWFPRDFVVPTETEDGKEDFEWFRQGATGWFGMRSEDMTDLEWSKFMVGELLKQPTDSRVYYVDFHI